MTRSAGGQPSILNMKKLAALLLVVLSLRLTAAPPPGYYAPAEGLDGHPLRSALAGIIDGHTVVTYSNTEAAIKTLDEAPGDPLRVHLVYSGATDLKDNFGLTTGWNREHLWPDSYGIDGSGPSYSDLHNLRSIDATVNSSRGNKYFDVSDVTAPAYRFPAHLEAPGCSTDSDSWEPRAEDRGNVARAVLYMATRYLGELHATEDTASITSAAARMGRLSVLLRWHAEDPPDAAELARNDAVFTSYQGNRNPFIDRPEFADRAFRPRLHAEPGGVLWWDLGWTTAARVWTAPTVVGPWTLLPGTSTNTGARIQITAPTPAFFRLESAE
jgi:endonuclease I